MSEVSNTRIHSTCPHDCPSTCALEIECIDEHTIGRIYGAKDNDYTAGTLCAKVGRYAERVHHPHRLGTPLKRVGEKGVGLSAFKPISWEAALDETAEQLLQVAQKYGSEAVWPYFYAGTMGLVQRDGIERLRHVMKYSRQHSTICITLADAGWIAGTGIKRGVDPREMAHSDLIVVWGGNPVNTQVNAMHHITQARRIRGAKLVVIDPYRTASAQKADLHLMLRPGTDGALACAVMHVLIQHGYADREYMQQYTDASTELEQHLESKTPEWAAKITGLSAKQIIDFAHLYGSTQRAFIRFGYGFTRSRNGAANMHAASCLPAITGAWRYQGGGALYSNSGMYKIDKTLIEGLDAKDPTIRVLDQSRIAPVLTHDPVDLQGGPPVNAIFIQNTNPVVVCPDSNKVREGFARKDLFVCVHEQFMTETAAMADIVLPATMFVEHHDLYQGGGHSYLQVTKPVITPFAQCQSNHWVVCQLARRLGAHHEGFNLTAWDLIDDALKRSGYIDAETLYRQRWLDCIPKFEEAHFLNGFHTPDKRFHFQPDWGRVGKRVQDMPSLPDHVANIDESSNDYPFRLVTAPARHFLNTTFTETPTSAKKEVCPQILIHPRDCEKLNIESGQHVLVGNRLGAVKLHVESFDGLQPGVVVVESIWPNSAFEDSVGINALISPDVGQPNGGAVIHDTAVWIKSIEICAHVESLH